MVCISCILIPLALFVWHRFLRPFFARWWPSLADKVEKKLEGPGQDQDKKASCPFSNGSATDANNATAAHTGGDGGGSKKDD